MEIKNRKVKIINMTGHDVHELITGTTIKKLPSEVRKEPRAMISTKHVYSANDIPVVTSSPTSISKLPDRKKDTIFIVSSMCLSAMERLGITDREDIVAPGPTRIWKDGPLKGTIEGCEGFRTVCDSLSKEL